MAPPRGDVPVALAWVRTDGMASTGDSPGVRQKIKEQWHRREVSIRTGHTSVRAAKSTPRNVHQMASGGTRNGRLLDPDGPTGITTARNRRHGASLRIQSPRRANLRSVKRKDHREAWEEVIR